MQDRKKIRILIIDDDDTFRELASMLLAEAGYAIETAEDAIEGGKALLTPPWRTRPVPLFRRRSPFARWFAASYAQNGPRSA